MSETLKNNPFAILQHRLISLRPEQRMVNQLQMLFQKFLWPDSAFHLLAQSERRLACLFDYRWETCMADDSVTLYVELNGTGRYSLIERAPGERSEQNLAGALFANPDAEVFYRAVARHIADWAAKHVPIEYRDVDDQF